MLLHWTYDVLPSIPLTVTHRSRTVTIASALIDTGSAGTILSADRLAEIGVLAAHGGRLRTVFGVGGAETTFTYILDRLQIGESGLESFTVEVGAMDYGTDAPEAILGMDFLLAMGTIIDLVAGTIEFASASVR